MYFKDETAESAIGQPEVTPAYNGLLILTAAIIILLGVMPGLVIDWLYY
jgi:hypothetical protein